MTLTRAVLLCGLLALVSAAAASAQFLTIGAGALVTKRSTEPVAELHGETPPLAGARGHAGVCKENLQAAGASFQAGAALKREGNGG